MDIANFISLSLEMITQERYEILKKILSKNMPDYKLKSSDVENFVNLLKKDKKSTKGKIVCILPTGKEKVEVVDIDDEERLKTLILAYRRR
jgi:3-dehydroquinate synthetase